MEYQEMKNFIQVSADYMRNNTEKSGSDLQTHLHIIASATNLSVFNPDSQVGPHFYINLHQLMGTLDLQSPLVWSTISALQKACANRKARESLIHVYKFIPVLSRFLSVSDKQHKVLQILQELTYGVKVTWQEAHLPQLITTLTQIIMGKNKDYKTQALNVIVNLCYKNPPVLYVLMKKVEIKNFIKCVTKMNDNASVRMLACKMLIILSELKGPLPDTDILNFVDVSFNCIADAFQHRDLITLHQMADFFKDMENSTQFQKAMEKYPKTVEDTKRLIDLLDDIEEDCLIDECVAVLLSFIDTAFKIKISKTIKLAPRLLASIIPWITNDKTCPSALNIILSITSSCCNEIDSGSSELLQTYATIVPKVMEILTCCNLGLSEETKERLAAALNLLAHMSLASNNLANMVIQVLTCEDVKNIFEKLYKQNYFLEKSLIDNVGTNLSMHLLFLIGALAHLSSDWMDLHSELLNTPQILLSLAVTIMYDEKDTKYKVFKLMSCNSWRDDSLAALSSMMAQFKTDIKMDKESKQPLLGFPETTPIFVSETRIDELLENLKRSNISEPSTSEIMELYEYKLAAMVHSERRLQTALEASDTHCVGLNHQLAQLKNEDARLHQMLFYLQQTVEGASAEKNDLMNQISKLTSETSLEKAMNAKKIKQLTKRCQEMEDAFREREVKLQEEISKNDHLSLVLEAKTVECDEITSKLQECRSKCEDLIRLKVLTEQSLEKAKSQIAEYEMQIADYKSENDDLKSSLAETKEENTEKDEKIAEFSKQIQYLEQIREAVISVAAKKGGF